MQPHRLIRDSSKRSITSRGLNTEDMDQVAEAIAMVIKGGEEQVPAARAIIQKLTDKYPLI